MKKALVFMGPVSAAVVLSLFALAWSTGRGAAPGLNPDGRLTSCPDRPNCVSSEEGDVPPLSFSGTPDSAWKNIRLTLDNLGGSVVREEEHYLAATFQSAFFGFMDDLEFRMIPGENLIHVRAASRTGYSDLGVNRKRVETFRERFRLNE